MDRYILSILSFLLLLPSAASATTTRLLRRGVMLQRYANRNTPANVPSDMAVLFNEVLNNEDDEQLLWQLMREGSSFFSLSMSMTTRPPAPVTGCHSAYVYCGQGVSTCELNGGWAVDLSVLHLDSGGHIQCELRLGNGRCTEADYELSLEDIPIGSFEITGMSMRTELLSSFDIGLVPEIFLDSVDRRPMRHLSPYNGNDPAGFAQHLYHDLVWNYEDHSIKFGAELSQEHVAIYATVCSCETGQCGDEPFTSTSSPSSNLSDSPSLTPSIIDEPSLSPTSQSSTTTQLPTTAPSTAATQSRGGGGANPLVGSESSAAGNAGSSLGTVSLIAIVVGCVVAVIAVALVVAIIQRKNSIGGGQQSHASVSSDPEDILVDHGDNISL